MNILGIGAIVDSVGKVIGDLHTSDKERAELELKGRELDQKIDLAQIEVNKTEAASASTFTSGWRPAIGWVCAMSLFVYYVPYCVVATALWAHQVWVSGQLVTRPDLGIADLLGLVGAMLGLSTLRTAEKFKGVAKG